MKEEALKLADELQDYMTSLGWKTHQAPDMIRRLVEELNKWEKDLHLQSHVLGLMEGKAAQAEEHMMLQQPLSDNEIHDIWKSLWEGGNIGHIAYNYARAIEERHGIK